MLAERRRELEAVDAVLVHGGVLVVAAGAGLGKTSLLGEAAVRARRRGREVLPAACSPMESSFPFGVVRQLFERRVSALGDVDRDGSLAGRVAAARRMLMSEVDELSSSDSSFAILHGLYWLADGLAERCPLAIVIDDAQWADAGSRRWLAHLGPRLDGPSIAVIVAQRTGGSGDEVALVEEPSWAASVVRPQLLSLAGVELVAREVLGDLATPPMCAELWEVTGGNPFYVAEVLRGGAWSTRPGSGRGLAGVRRHVLARLKRLDVEALALARAAAVLGDRCRLDVVAAVTGLEVVTARRAASALVDAEVLADADPPRFLHPIIRDAVLADVPGEELERAQRTAAHSLFEAGAPVEQVAAHLMLCESVGDGWVVARLRDAAQAAMVAAEPTSAARLLRRALAEPPESAVRVGVLREVAGAEASAGLATARDALAEALALTADVRERAEIALQAAEADAALFRWVEAVDIITTALAELDAADVDLAGQLEALLVVCAMHDARRAAAVGPTLQRLALRDLAGAAAEGRAVAVGMGMVLAGAPASDAAAVLMDALADGPDDRVENWDARAALWWSLITAEDFDDVERSLARRADEVDRSGSARALVAVYSTRGLLELRRGRLAEGDTAARIAMGVLQAGDFAPGLVFGVTVLADLCVEAGDLDQAAELLALLPAGPLEPGVGTVLIPAARGRLQLAQRQWDQAQLSFDTCAAMFSPASWGLPVRDVGYVHARSGLAVALLGLGQTDAAAQQAEAELQDVRRFGGRRAVGVSSRVAGLVAGGERGEQLLIESVEALRASPARLELAKSLVEVGAARRRSGRRRDAREWLADGLELAAASGAPPLVQRARHELLACGARPRRDWRHGVASLTPSERRVAELAAAGRTNREIAIELYVTRKTVEGHLARVYTKLQIPGRPELARVLDAKDEGGDPLADDPRGG